MSTLAGTTWTFSTTGNLAGTIAFQQLGPNLHSGVATITPTNPQPGSPFSWTAAWAELEDGNQFAVQFSNFSGTPNPPPMGIPTINAGQIDMQPVTLFGSHADGIATMYGTNFQTQTASGHVLGGFTMTVVAN